MVKQTQLAHQIGTSQQFISALLKGKAKTSLPKAIKIEKATRGKIKVEDIVRPEVAEALKEYVRLRCPMGITIEQSPNSSKCEEKEEAYG